MSGRRGFDEPRRHRGFLLLLGLAVVATAPLPFVAAPTRLWQGLPLWLWWSFGATVALSLLTAWGFLRYWRDEDE